MNDHHYPTYNAPFDDLRDDLEDYEYVSEIIEQLRLEKKSTTAFEARIPLGKRIETYRKEREELWKSIRQRLDIINKQGHPIVNYVPVAVEKIDALNEQIVKLTEKLELLLHMKRGGEHD